MIAELAVEKITCRKTDIDFTIACNLAENINSIKSHIKGLGEDIWQQSSNPQKLRNVLKTITDNSQLINRYIDTTVETIQIVDKYRQQFAEQPFEFFNLAFGFSPQTAADKLQLRFTPFGVYFLVNRGDYNKLKRHNFETLAFVSSRQDFVSFADLKCRVGIFNLGQSRIKMLNTIDEEQDEIENSFSQLLGHENNHLWFYQNINSPQSISEQEIEQLVKQLDNLPGHYDLLKKISDNILISNVMERVAYAMADNKFNLDSNQVGRTEWRYYFKYLFQAINKYPPHNCHQIRNIWLEAFKNYLDEEKLIAGLAFFMMHDVEVIGDGLKRKTTLSNMDKDIAHIVYALMVPENTQALLEGLGFASAQDFLNYLESIEVFKLPTLLSSHQFFDVEELDPNTIPQTFNETLVYTGDGFQKESEIQANQTDQETIEPLRLESGPLAKYLEFLNCGGNDGLILEGDRELQSLGKDKTIVIDYYTTLYLGDPIKLIGTNWLIDDFTTFLNIHLQEAQFVSSTDLLSVIKAYTMVKKIFGRLAHKLDSGAVDSQLIVAATNFKLINILTKMGFTIVDYLPDGVTSKLIVNDTSSHDKILAERIAKLEFPIAVMSGDEFIKRFIRFYKPQPTIKQLWAVVETSED